MSTSEQHPIPALSKMSLDTQPKSSKTEDLPTATAGAVQIVNPWEVTAADENGIDYDKLIETFGTRKISQELLDRFERLTGRKPHRYLRRGHFFSERLLLTFG
jgi:tryptophanyl-tRNA synthetase